MGWGCEVVIKYIKNIPSPPRNNNNKHLERETFGLITINSLNATVERKEVFWKCSSEII